MLRLPTPQTAPLSFGISVHDAFYNFYLALKNGNKPSLSDFQNLLSARWISEGYADKIHEKKMAELGKRIIDNYYNKLLDSKLPLALEVPFSFFLKRDGKLPVKILGKMDRVDPLNNGIEIIDYKTGNSQGMSKANYDLQLGVYALAATEVEDKILRRNPEDITVSLLYLEEGIKKSERMTRGRIEETRMNILQKIQEIESSDFKCSKSILCQNCEYKMLCSTN
jgi:RecB family exonuclease